MTEDQIKNINAVADICHENARAHGFHDYEENEGHFITRSMMLVNTETAELYEAYRGGTLDDICDKAEKMRDLGHTPLTNKEEELADIVIRAFDISRRLGVDIGRAVAVKHAYNVTRPYRHGNKAA